MKSSIIISMTALGILALTGCSSTQENSKQKSLDWFSCATVINEQKQGPEVERAKATLEQIAFQPDQINALFCFINLVPESPRHTEAIQRYSDFIQSTVTTFTKGNSQLIVRGDRDIPGPPILGIGATMTINGVFTREQMRYYGFYSWPTALLTVHQQMKELTVSKGEGVILDYDNGKAYVFGCDFVK
jgi:hypothetical protein